MVNYVQSRGGQRGVLENLFESILNEDSENINLIINNPIIDELDINANIDSSIDCKSISDALAKTNNVDLARRLLGRGLNINLENEFGYTSLFIATKYDNRDMIRFLISEGANDLGSSFMGIALHGAAYLNNLDMASFIFQCREELGLGLGVEDINSTAAYLERTPLDCLVYTYCIDGQNDYNHIKDLFEFFLDNGADLEMRNRHTGRTIIESLQEERERLIRFMPNEEIEEGSNRSYSESSLRFRRQYQNIDQVIGNIEAYQVRSRVIDSNDNNNFEVLTPNSTVNGVEDFILVDEDSNFESIYDRPSAPISIVVENIVIDSASSDINNTLHRELINDASVKEEPKQRTL